MSLFINTLAFPESTQYSKFWSRIFKIWNIFGSILSGILGYVLRLKLIPK